MCWCMYILDAFDVERDLQVILKVKLRLAPILRRSCDMRSEIFAGRARVDQASAT